MIITTTNNIEGKRILEYKGVVFGEVISGIDFIKDFTAGLTNIFGGRSGSYEQELIQARYNAMQEMEKHAFNMGANAVIGVTPTKNAVARVITPLNFLPILNFFIIKILTFFVIIIFLCSRYRCYTYHRITLRHR